MTDIGLRLKNDLDLHCKHSLCTQLPHLLTFALKSLRSSINSSHVAWGWKANLSCHKNIKINTSSSVEHFWAKIFKLTLCSIIFPCLILSLHRPRSTQDHYLNNLGSTLVSNATYQISRQSVQEKRLLKVFTVNRHGGHIGHVTLRVCTNFYSLSPKRL